MSHCPSCGSIRTLSELVADRYKLMEKAGEKTPRDGLAIPRKGSVIVGKLAESYPMMATMIGAGAEAESWGVAIGHEARAPEGGLALGQVVVETCLSCGTMYAGNVKEVQRALEADLDRLQRLVEETP